MPSAAPTLPEVPPWLLAPFALLLILIAIMPLISRGTRVWWEKHHPIVSLGLAVGVLGFYCLARPGGPARSAATLHEYISFIVLIGSLFVVASGIRLDFHAAGRPAWNVLFLFVGAVLANLIGTTGASIVLIRPFIRMNKIRAGSHHIVFFIFIVSNVGGALTPIGDPPLFLGYLHGVPFFWLLQHVLPAWLCAVGLLLGIFYIVDRRSYRHAPPEIREQAAAGVEAWHLGGARNLVFLALILGAVFVTPRYFARETLMLAAGLASYLTTPPAVHAANHFNFGPIREVAILFAGIFATMMPALDYLEIHGDHIPATRPIHYYYATGGLSAVLDNAPTYMNFLTLAEVRVAGRGHGTTAANTSAQAPGHEGALVAQLVDQHPAHLLAITLGAVFFGAMTYIGNGPNFLVRSIASAAGVRTPNFLNYILRYSLPLLLPVLILVGWLFL